MFAPEIPYSVCVDPACADRTCTPCSFTPPIKSCCRKTVLCPTTGEHHDCATKKAAS